MNKVFRLALICALFFVFSSVAYSQVTLPAIFGDHMVIQRNMPVRVWGNASFGETVTVTFRGETRQTVADELGHWQVTLPPGGPGGPFVLSVRATNALEFTDVMVGDVWIASGQSNMGFRTRDVANAAAEMASANRPPIRLFKVLETTSDYPLEQIAAKPWVACTPEAVADFSAIGYLFARGIQDSQKVPVGIIQSAWGGTPAEAWTSLPSLSADASLMPMFAARAQHAIEESLWAHEQERRRRETEAATAAGKPAPTFPWHPDFKSWGPGAIYNAMIAPIVQFPIRGVIWYQGESNTDAMRAPVYTRLFQTMIRDWRSNWRQGDFPFLFVQLANFKAEDGTWAEVRDAQRRALMLKNTAMAVAIDIGNANDIHPTNKQDVAKRLVLAARVTAYGEKIEYSGPLYRAATREANTVRVWFDHAGSGLAPKGDALKGFEIAGPDRKFVPAIARIDGDTVIVSSEQVSAPSFVRYGWASSPEVNLYNKEGLPASPFESE